MKKTFLFASILTCAISVNAQNADSKNAAAGTSNAAAAPAIVITPTSTPTELARAAIQAQG